MQDFFKKEKPFQGLTGFGGGATGLSNAGGVIPITATGGAKDTPGNGYTYHRFNTGFPGAIPINFVITEGTAEFDCVIMGAGGGGGYDRGGGGGGGAFYPLTLTAVVGTHPLSLGTGGEGDTSSPGSEGGETGGNTTFTYNGTAYVANGGGGGTGDGNTSGGKASPGNGSGGGTTGSPVGASPWPGGASGDYGNPGKGSTGNGTGGGGGGAGAGGPDAPQPNTSSTAFIGGSGATTHWMPTAEGNNGYFAAGGGGGGYQYPVGTAQASILGGGGRGGVDGPPGTMAATDANTNGSGGGGGDGGTSGGGDGYAGCMYIRYSV